MTDEPQAMRRGWLKNSNPPGDFSKAPRCGARTRAGGHCRAPAMKNGRCRMHGARAPDPAPPEGLEQDQLNNKQHAKEHYVLLQTLRGCGVRCLAAVHPAAAILHCGGSTMPACSCPCTAPRGFAEVPRRVAILEPATPHRLGFIGHFFVTPPPLPHPQRWPDRRR